MRALLKLVALAYMLACLGGMSARAQARTKKPALPPPLPVGGTGPLLQMPLDQMPAVLPQVKFRDGELAIIAPNSTLTDILRCVRDQTGAEIEIPVSNERVAARFGPGPVRDVLTELLNGSQFNFALLGSPTEWNSLTKVVLLVKPLPEVPAAVPGMLQKVPPSEMSRAPNSSNPPSNIQQTVSSQETPASTPEVVPPPPAVDGAIEMPD